MLDLSVFLGSPNNCEEDSLDLLVVVKVNVVKHVSDLVGSGEVDFIIDDILAYYLIAVEVIETGQVEVGRRLGELVKLDFGVL